MIDSEKSINNKLWSKKLPTQTLFCLIILFLVIKIIRTIHFNNVTSSWDDGSLLNLPLMMYLSNPLPDKKSSFSSLPISSNKLPYTKYFKNLDHIQIQILKIAGTKILEKNARLRLMKCLDSNLNGLFLVGRDVDEDNNIYKLAYFCFLDTASPPLGKTLPGPYLSTLFSLSIFWRLIPLAIIRVIILNRSRLLEFFKNFLKTILFNKKLINKESSSGTVFVSKKTETDTNKLDETTHKSTDEYKQHQRQFTWETVPNKQEKAKTIELPKDQSESSVPGNPHSRTFPCLFESKNKGSSDNDENSNMSQIISQNSELLYFAHNSKPKSQEKEEQSTAEEPGEDETKIDTSATSASSLSESVSSSYKWKVGNINKLNKKQDSKKTTIPKQEHKRNSPDEPKMSFDITTVQGRAAWKKYMIDKKRNDNKKNENPKDTTKENEIKEYSYLFKGRYGQEREKKPYGNSTEINPFTENLPTNGKLRPLVPYMSVA
ncbi:uncharacterized protein NDAI_0E00740 [Naumovozyma dairenensis CBS 421]|uniref:Uncharacterized protein n=1 Tax=Naumovozyma dairenensis (strain ATCC 10597 / BCRC 20456 / CBS 421 / NBRC 0211 / NRRL Y-12639) TaxID=1071378 RepID=G0WAX0_NAUDC|nr:hypothetical protein NDAI_0E00740 [Naumovozyma dairenensis CBS 421]CCD24890.1 hypothetical protein NDAI_0E00740 [Naumovozyma dairenensis CBS 421]